MQNIRSEREGEIENAQQILNWIIVDIWRIDALRVGVRASPNLQFVAKFSDRGNQQISENWAHYQEFTFKSMTKFYESCRRFNEYSFESGHVSQY